MKWVYGVTTILERRDNLLPRTLSSLKRGGFDSPCLFVDGITHKEALVYEERFKLEVVNRNPRVCKEAGDRMEVGKSYGVRTFGNWLLGLQELYLRDPEADRYAMFQDDMVTYANLRQYLEKCKFPLNGYWNLYTFPNNHAFFKRVGQTGRFEIGWAQTNQRGLGAVGLVFNRLGVTTLLGSKHMVERPLSKDRGWRNIDGGIVSAFVKAGGKEFVHNPSLVQHVGTYSSMGNPTHQQAIWWRGEEFDALSLVNEARHQ